MHIRISRALRYLLPLAGGALLIGIPGVASAQSTITVTKASVDREVSRESESYPYSINIEECEADIETTLTLSLPERGTVSLYGSTGGQDCSTSATRGDDPGNCWRIVDGVTANTLTSFRVSFGAMAQAGVTSPDECDGALEADIEVYIVLEDGGNNIATATWKNRVDLERPVPPSDVSADIGEASLVASWSSSSTELVAGYEFYCAQATSAPGGDSAAGGAGGTGSSDSVEAGAGGGDTASAFADPQGDSLSTITQAASASGATAGGAAGSPAAGTGAAGSAGGTALAGNSTSPVAASGAGGSGVDAAGQSAGGESGTTSSEQNDTSSSTSSAEGCYASGLVAGEVPEVGGGVTQCGSSSGTTTVKSNTSHLDNYVEWAVSVVSVDDMGNTSVLSAPACATPEELTDFFESYRDESGRGGGGYCALTRRDSSPIFGAGLLVAALALSARRKRRARRRAS